MIESGRVIAVEKNALWVETIQQSTCASCAAKSGCGQGLMSKHSDGKRNQLRIGAGRVHVDDSWLGKQVSFEVADRTVLGGAALVYMLPLVAMLSGGAAASQYSHSDGVIAAAAAASFAAALGVARLVVNYWSAAAAYEPQLAEDLGVSSLKSKLI